MRLLSIGTRALRNIGIAFGDYYQKVKCEKYLFFHGYDGLCYVIKHLPKKYIIPILRIYGAEVGTGCDIDTGLMIHRVTRRKDFRKLKIGKEVHIGYNMLLDLSANIEIGSFSAFGTNCQIWTHTGNWTNDRSDESDKINPVHVGMAVICYSGVIISQGVAIQDFARVAGGSVVTKDVKRKTFVGGAPAKVIRVIADAPSASGDGRCGAVRGAERRL